MSEWKGRALCLEGKQKFSALCSSGVVSHQGTAHVVRTDLCWFGAGLRFLYKCGSLHMLLQSSQDVCDFLSEK